MRIIIPMAGKGSRLRPHTLTIPKPLVSVAGKPIVQRLVEDLAKAYHGKIEEVAYIVGQFGDAAERELVRIAESIGAKGSIYYQDLPKGSAHALLCAKESMHGPCMIALADTLFKADFAFDPSEDACIWVNKTDNPSAFGVVQLDDNQYIKAFVEKPTVFVSDLAMVGIYYIRDGEKYRDALQYVLDNDIKIKGEYQLTSGLELLLQQGTKFKTASIDEWLDCGNKETVIYTNQRILEHGNGTNHTDDSVTLDNSVIIQPSFIGKNAVIKNSVIGPYVSIGENSIIEHSVISNSVIQNDTVITDASLHDSMIGNFVEYQGRKTEISIGDYSKYSG
jgi:glucose-1-phosphate thymidylyltransferase